MCLYSSGSTLSPLAPLRRDLEAVMEITAELGGSGPRGPSRPSCVSGPQRSRGDGPAGGGTPRPDRGHRTSRLVVQRAGICDETIPLFSADWFRGAAGGWGITQLCLLVAAALVFAASRAMRSVTAGEPGESQAEMVWRRPVAALADYLIVVAVLSAVVGGGLVLDRRSASRSAWEPGF